MEPSEEVRLREGHALPIMEHFYSVQGEGAHTGTASYFIRIGGCDVGCHWCDVKESWNPDVHPIMEVDEVIAATLEWPSKTVILTGGEPLIYNLEVLCSKLHEHGFTIHVETSGAYPLVGSADWICLSPKKTAPPLNEVLQMADELKVIVYNNDDLKWAESFVDKVPECTKLYLQPEWGKQEAMMPVIIEHVKSNVKWNISLQTHKYMRIP